MQRPVRWNRKLECICLRFRRVVGKYEKSAIGARGQGVPQVSAALNSPTVRIAERRFPAIRTA